MKVLLAVDGSDPAIQATRQLIETLGRYKQMPAVEVLSVQPPVPQLAGMHSVVTRSKRIRAAAT